MVTLNYITKLDSYKILKDHFMLFYVLNINLMEKSHLKLLKFYDFLV